ncbi:hypothetical protein EG68_08034 [Paragonimus skrjabini miyazakii]|uniref:Uncharacterized protein n=1 Tax=Paragonimus skrjabini miyazakii TaxID=59628 RepID=A0A8S9YU80_9TREM|nr:hypothetical protein EG68_08034 [Paragonimus skrjabini miyazakii]
MENQSPFQMSDISDPKPFKKPRARNAKDQNSSLPNVILINTNGEKELLLKPSGQRTSAEVLPIAFSTQESNDFRFLQSPPLDSNRTGYATGQDVVAYWSRLGAPEPEKTLKHLGFQVEQQIDLKKLMNLLENRVISLIPRDNPVCTAALLTLLNERCLTESDSGSQQREVDGLSKVQLVEQNVLAEQFRQEIGECRSELKRVSDEKDRLQSEVDIEKKKNDELLTNFLNSQSQLIAVSNMMDAKQEEVSSLRTAHHALEEELEQTRLFKTEYEEIKQQLEEAIKLANTSSIMDSKLPLLIEALQTDADDRKLLQTIHGELLTEQQHLRQTLLQTQNQLEELKVIREERNSDIKDLQKLNQSLMETVNSLGKTLSEKNKEVLFYHQMISELKHNLTTVNEEKNELNQQNARLQDQITQLESGYEKRLYETRLPEEEEEEETSRSRRCRNASRINPAKSAEKLACQLEIALKERAALLEYQLELEETLKIQAQQINMLEHRGSTWNLEPDRTDNKDNLPVAGTNVSEWPEIPVELNTTQSPVARKRTISIVHPEICQ